MDARTCPGRRAITFRRVDFRNRAWWSPFSTFRKHAFLYARQRSRWSHSHIDRGACCGSCGQSISMSCMIHAFTGMPSSVHVHEVHFINHAYATGPRARLCQLRGYLSTRCSLHPSENCNGSEELYRRSDVILLHGFTGAEHETSNRTTASPRTSRAVATVAAATCSSSSSAMGCCRPLACSYRPPESREDRTGGA